MKESCARRARCSQGGEPGNDRPRGGRDKGARGFLIGRTCDGRGEGRERLGSLVALRQSDGGTSELGLLRFIRTLIGLRRLRLG